MQDSIDFIKGCEHSMAVLTSSQTSPEDKKIAREAILNVAQAAQLMELKITLLKEQLHVLGCTK